MSSSGPPNWPLIRLRLIQGAILIGGMLILTLLSGRSGDLGAGLAAATVWFLLVGVIVLPILFVRLLWRWIKRRRH